MDYFQEYTDYLGLKGYDGMYKTHVKKHLEYCKANQVDPLGFEYKEMNEEITKMKDDGYANSYINVRMAAIRFYYTFLQDKLGVYPEEKLKSVCKVEALKVPRKKPVYLTSKEIDRAISDGMSYFVQRDPIKVRAIILFMFYTGLRLGEIAKLKREDINLKDMSALVRVPSKNSEERYTFFPARVRDALQEYFDIEPEETSAFNMSRDSLWRMVGRLNLYLKKNKKITPHSLRHSFANLLAEKQIGIRVAQKLLGHKSMASTLIYYDPDVKIVEKIYRANIDKKESEDEKDLGPTKTL